MLSDYRNRKSEEILYCMYLCQEMYSQRRNSVRCFSLIHDRSISTQNSQRISPACRVQWKCLPQPQASFELNLAGVDEWSWLRSPVFHHRASLTNTRASFWSAELKIFKREKKKVKMATLNVCVPSFIRHFKTERSNKLL